MSHFDSLLYKGDSSTLVFKIVDAICGTAGAGALVNEILLTRLGTAMETIYFNELDYIFGKINFLARSPAESYTYNPLVDLLNSDQWDEVRIKDAWYRQRITEFFAACNLGSTPDGIRTCVHAALAVDADIYEMWRVIDNYHIVGYLGRAEQPARNEIVIRPHKAELAPSEARLVRDMLDRVVTVDTVVTVDVNGLAVSNPVPVASACADSSYFEVQKLVTPTPVLDNIPPPEMLAIDLLPTETWMWSEDKTLAPYAAFSISQEASFYYLVGGGARSPIDSVEYGTLQADGSVRSEANFEVYESANYYTSWTSYELADSPDNYPGGKYGIHPKRAPAKNPDGTAYQFPYASQASWVAKKKAEVIALGGVATDDYYRLPITTGPQTRHAYLPEYAVAYSAPIKESQISSSITRRRVLSATQEVRSPDVFTRSTSG